MKFSDRLKIFGLGFVIGLVILFIIMGKKQGDERVQLTAPPTPEGVQREAVPGILDAYRGRRVSMESKFISEEHRTPLPNDAWRRTLVLRGHEKTQVLRVEEYYHEDMGIDLVDRAVVMAPDRLIVTLAPGATSPQLSELLKPLGARLEARVPDRRDALVIKLGGDTLAVYSESLARLRELPKTVADVQPLVYGEVEPFVEAERENPGQ